jgi:hypothetical protein
LNRPAFHAVFSLAASPVGEPVWSIPGLMHTSTCVMRWSLVVDRGLLVVLILPVRSC